MDDAHNHEGGAADGLRMDDLERLTGQPRRNIRFLIAEKVIPQPRSRGRKASYGPEHLEALKVYSRLKAAGISSLDVIRDRIGSARGGGPLLIAPMPGVEVRIEASVLRELGAEALARAIGDAVRTAAQAEPEEKAE
jgi:DNA-binding transcriptional MerR regulator